VFDFALILLARKKAPSLGQKVMTFSRFFKDFSSSL